MSQIAARTRTHKSARWAIVGPSLHKRTLVYWLQHLTLFDAHTLPQVSKLWLLCSTDARELGVNVFYRQIVIHGSMLADSTLFDDAALARILKKSGNLLHHLHLDQLPMLSMPRRGPLSRILRAQKKLIQCRITNCARINPSEQLVWLTNCAHLKTLSLKGCNMDAINNDDLFKHVKKVLPKVKFDLNPCEICKHVTWEDTRCAGELVHRESECAIQTDKFKDNKVYCASCTDTLKCSDCNNYFCESDNPWHHNPLECMDCHSFLCDVCDDKARKKRREEYKSTSSAELKHGCTWGCDIGYKVGACFSSTGSTLYPAIREGLKSDFCRPSTCPSCGIQCPTCDRHFCTISDDAHWWGPCNTMETCLCCAQTFCRMCIYKSGIENGRCSNGQYCADPGFCESFTCSTCQREDFNDCVKCGGYQHSMTELCRKCVTQHKYARSCDVCDKFICGGRISSSCYGINSCDVCGKNICDDCEPWSDWKENCNWRRVDYVRHSYTSTLIPTGSEHEFCCDSCAKECKTCGYTFCPCCEEIEKHPCSDWTPCSDLCEDIALEKS